MLADDAASRSGEGTAPTLLCRDANGIVPGKELELETDEVAHARALRLREGDEVELTDGRGGRWRGRMTVVGRRRASCAVLEPLEAVEPWPIELWAPVGQRERCLWLVEKATEIGVRAIRFVEWERSRSVADAGRSDGFLARTVRRAESALKQSGGSRLPEIEAPAPLDELLTPGEWKPARRLLADPDGSAVSSALSGALPEGEVVLLVGPEGGVTPDERDRCIATGCELVRLGPRVLRFETAAIVGLACMAAVLDERAGKADGASTRPRGVTTSTDRPRRTRTR